MNKIIAIVGASSLAVGVTYFMTSDSASSSSSPNTPSTTLTTQAPEVNSTLGTLVQLKDTTQRDSELTRYFKGYMPDDAHTAIDEINRLNNANYRELCYTLLLTVWYETDAESLTSWLQASATNPERDNALIHLIENPLTTLTAKLNFAEQLSTDTRQESTVTQLIHTWAVSDADTLILWATTPNTARDQWLTLVFKTLTQTSVTAAVNAVPYLEKSTEYQVRTAIQAIIDHYEAGTVDHDTLVALQRLSPYALREELIGALLPLLAFEESFSLDDLDTLLSSVFDGPQKDTLLEQLVRSWAFRDPQEAASYAVALEGDARSQAINGVVSSWIQEDLEAADTWLASVEGDIDMAANTLGRGSAQLGNVQIADTWINTIKDDAMRTSAIVDVLSDWYKASPEAGIYHLVYQKSLSNQEKLNLLHEIYPNEVFLSPMEALDEIGRLEGLSPAY